MHQRLQRMPRHAGRASAPPSAAGSWRTAPSFLLRAGTPLAPRRLALTLALALQQRLRAGEMCLANHAVSRESHGANAGAATVAPAYDACAGQISARFSSRTG